MRVHGPTVHTTVDMYCRKYCWNEAYEKEQTIFFPLYFGWVFLTHFQHQRQYVSTNTALPTRSRNKLKYAGKSSILIDEELKKCAVDNRIAKLLDVSEAYLLWLRFVRSATAFSFISVVVRANVCWINLNNFSSSTCSVYIESIGVLTHAHDVYMSENKFADLFMLFWLINFLSVSSAAL